MIEPQQQFGCVLVFKEGTTSEEARKALETIKDSLHPYGTDDGVPYIHPFDPKDGGPVWHIP